MGIKLKPHNQTAYDKVKDVLAEDNKTAVVHPTGTGKTYIALKWIEEHGGKTLYIAPTNHILNQVKETIEEARANGEITDEEYVRYQKIEFKTYTKLMELSKVGVGYETIILDEFHRCGAPEWGKGVERLLAANLNAKVVGMTATPMRAVDNKDMADELFQGKIASEMTLEEAVAEGIIEAPIYVNGIYSLETVIAGIEGRIPKVRDGKLRKELEKKLEKAKEKARRYLEGAEGIEDIVGKYANKKDGKYIVFCNDIEDMRKKMQEAQNWFQKAGNVQGVKLYKIYHEESEYRNEKTIRQFREEKDGMVHLLFCIDKLNEGVHVKGIDGVIMLRKTESPIVYMQQLGRALSAGNDGIPLVLDLVNNIDSMGYIYDFMRRVEEIRREKGIDDENIGNIKIYEDQREITEILREITEKLRRDSTSIAIFVKVCESLAKQGFDFKDFIWSKTINGMTESKTLEDIAKDEKYSKIDINRVLEEIGVDIHYRIGTAKAHAVQAVTGTSTNLITQEEMQKLIELGVIIEFINAKERWDKKYELLKGLLEAEGEYLGLTVDQVKKEQEKLKKRGSISYALELQEVKGKSKPVKLGVWLTDQRAELLKPYRGKTIEEIEQDETIDLRIKRKIRLLLDLGVKALEKDQDELSIENWDKKYELLKGLLEAKGEYLGLTADQVKAEQEKFRKTGGISKELKSPELKEFRQLGIWVGRQKDLLKPYKGKTIEEIEQNDTIDAITKSRVKRLLELASDRKTRKEQLVEQWDKKFELLKGLLEAKGEYLGLTADQVKAEQEKFEKTGRITHALKLLNVERAYRDLGAWVDKQKELLKSYKEKTIEEIEQDDTIDAVTKRRLKILLELGMRDSDEKKTVIATFIRVCESLVKYGVDFRSFEWSNRSEKDGKKVRNYKTLANVAEEYPAVDIKSVLEETGVSIDYKIGEYKNHAVRSARLFPSKAKKGTLPITEEEKQKLIKLGVMVSEKSQNELNIEIWNKKYEALKKLLETGEKIRNSTLKGWVAEQKKKLLKRYSGKTLEEIERDETISAETKRRIRLLLEIGIKVPKPKSSQELGQATFTAGTEGQKKLDEAQGVLGEAIQEQKRKSEQKEGGIVQDDNDEL